MELAIKTMRRNYQHAGLSQGWSRSRNRKSEKNISLSPLNLSPFSLTLSPFTHFLLLR